VTRIILFTQPGCFSCDLVKTFLEAREIAFEELDISLDSNSRRQMTEDYDSNETPTLVILSGDTREVVIGFTPARLDQLLTSLSSSGAVNPL